ncbi:hypothetical protein CX658_19370 [Pseudomonas amygdali pv. lachrymans]|nr:hypothetical protein ASC85_09125 [Pseudomonas sp. Root401]PWD02114.1 hypothetical protein CX658_19370 [Pseudomonas amygdali pv. lachrymans]
MFTFTHPLAPTVKYEGELSTSIATYAADHLHEYDVYLAEVEASAHGIGIELFAKTTGKPLGVVVIH